MTTSLGSDTSDQVRVDPLELLAAWRSEARYLADTGADEIVLFTRTQSGEERARWMSAPEFGADGFVFFTRRGDPQDAIDVTHGAAALVRCSVLEREVRLAGRLERLDRRAAEATFRTRPRESQLLMHAGMWSAEQPTPEAIGASVDALDERFAGQPVPLPPGWDALRFRAHRYEFWADDGDGLARMVVA